MKDNTMTICAFTVSIMLIIVCCISLERKKENLILRQTIKELASRIEQDKIRSVQEMRIVLLDAEITRLKDRILAENK